MNRRLEIMASPESPQERLLETIEYIKQIDNKYHGAMMDMDEHYQIQMNPSFTEQYCSSHIGGYLIKMSDGPKYIEYTPADRWIHENEDFWQMNTLFRYFNWCLTELERAVITCQHFKSIKKVSRKSILETYQIGTKKFYNTLGYAEEKLIEVWALDRFGDLDGDWYSILGNGYVEYQRTKRTGIKGGYIGLHPEWQTMFLEPGGTATSPGGDFIEPPMT